MSILRSINEGFERKYGSLVADRKPKEVKECNGECKDKKPVKECDDTETKGKVIRRPAMKEASKKVKKPIKEYKDMGQELGEYQKWVDYDMKRYGKISDKTMNKVKSAGLTVVKDKYGDYEVIAHEPVKECDCKDKGEKKRVFVKEAADKLRMRRIREAKNRAVVKEAVERIRARKLQESKKQK